MFSKFHFFYQIPEMEPMRKGMIFACMNGKSSTEVEAIAEFLRRMEIKFNGINGNFYEECNNIIKTNRDLNTYREFLDMTGVESTYVKCKHEEVRIKKEIAILSNKLDLLAVYKTKHNPKVKSINGVVNLVREQVRKLESVEMGKGKDDNKRKMNA